MNKCRGDYLEFVSKGTGMLEPGTAPVDGIFSRVDWRNFILPGSVRAAVGLKDDGPFVENSSKAHNAEFYHKFKSYVSKQFQELIGDLCGFEDAWCPLDLY